MSLPTAYTEKTLATFMADEIGQFATVFSWTVGSTDAGSYAEVVNTVLEMAGKSAVADLAVVEARALARICIWRRVLKMAATEFDFEADGGSFTTSQVQSMASKALNEAIEEAGANGYGPYAIDMTHETYENDPSDLTSFEDETYD